MLNSQFLTVQFELRCSPSGRLKLCSLLSKHLFWNSLPFNGFSVRSAREVYVACDAFVCLSSASLGARASDSLNTSRNLRDHPRQRQWNSHRQSKTEEIAKQIEMLINNPKLCKKLEENAYRYVKDDLSWEKYAESVESVFK